MRTTIKDVAKAAGVSPSTVSLVMNGKDSAIFASKLAVGQVTQSEGMFAGCTKLEGGEGTALPSKSTCRRACYQSVQFHWPGLAGYRQPVLFRIGEAH